MDLSKLSSELAAYLRGVDALSTGVENPAHDPVFQNALAGKSDREQQRLAEEWREGWKAAQDIVELEKLR